MFEQSNESEHDRHDRLRHAGWQPIPTRSGKPGEWWRRHGETLREAEALALVAQEARERGEP